MARKHAKITDAEAADLVLARVDVRNESPERQPFDRMMLRNRAFYFGKQSFVEDPRTGRLRDPASLPPGRVLYRNNFIKGDVQRAMLTVTGARGEFVVPPKDNTRQARHAAWVSTKLFEHTSRALRMEQKEQIATLFACIDGSVIWKPTWDPDRGEPDRFYWADTTGKRVIVDPDPRTKAEKEEAGHYDDLPPGDVGLEIWPMLQFDWDWRAREGGIEDCYWISFKQAVSMQYVEEQWPEKAHLVKPDETLQGALYYNEAISFMASNYAPLSTYRSRQDEQEEQVIVVEMWERPSPKNGNQGRKIVWAGDAIMENRDNVYRKTHFPLPAVKQDWNVAPGRFLGLSLVEDLTSLQRHHNRAAGKLIEHGDVFGAPAIFVPEHSGIPVGHYAVQPGCVYTYKPAAGKIETGPTPELPKEIAEVVAMTRQAAAEITSQQSLDGSKLPGQLRSGPALETILDERNKSLVHAATQFLIAKALVGQQLLELEHRYYSPNRVIKYVGEDKRFRVLSFSMADVQTDLHVIIDRSKILSSPTSERARMTEALQAGALDPINNPNDKIDVFKVLEFGTVQDMITDRLQEEENAEREILEMNETWEELIQPRADMMAPQEIDQETGRPMPRIVRGLSTNPYDDDETHVRVHLRFVRSEEFRALEPKAQSVHLLHLEEHQGKIEAKQMQQLMMMEALKGGQGQKGRPSPPKVASA